MTKEVPSIFMRQSREIGLARFRWIAEKWVALCEKWVAFPLAAGVYSSAAAEKYQPDTNAPNAKARRDAARKVYETAWQRHVQSPDEASAAEFFRLEAEGWLFAVNYAVK